MIPVFGRFRSFGPVSPWFSSADSLLLVGVLAEARPPDKGLGGRLVVRTPPRGGCGKALMLIVFLSVFPALFTPGAVRSLGRVVLPDKGWLGDGLWDAEGARRPLL